MLLTKVSKRFKEATRMAKKVGKQHRSDRTQQGRRSHYE